MNTLPLPEIFAGAIVLGFICVFLMRLHAEKKHQKHILSSQKVSNEQLTNQLAFFLTNR